MSGLFDEHRRELLRESGIAENIVTGRGYRSISRPSTSDDRPRQELRRLGIPTWAINEDRYFPGLLIPLYRPGGERISAIWKPRVPVRNSDGKPMKYAAAKGRPSVIDVHPVNRDRIVDITVPLWVTEGVKKADALASHGVCTAALSGVFNWRSTLGALGDWEDVPLRGRQVVICFDADARHNPNVMRAMVRFGRWLKAKGVKQALYLIVPAEVGGQPVKGADDYLAAGGSIDELRAAATTQEPRTEAAGDTFTDARLAETLADEVLSGGFCWAAGLGWMQWEGRRWAACSDVAVGEAVRQYSLERFAEAVSAVKGAQGGGQDAVDGWRAMLSASRERAVIGLAKGIVERRPEDFDRNPDLLNTASGVVDLETGDLLPHEPNLMMTKMAGGDYRTDATHPDWDRALLAMPDDVRDYMQVRLGQAITGHMTPDDALVVQQGGGENGKSTLNETVARSVGDYFLLVSDRALMANPDAHPTELMDFKGARYAVLEETPEARRLDPQRLKRTVGTPRITARRIRQDSVTFDATHSLFLSTNHRPNVEESDHGTWRRLILVRFPYRFRKPHEALEGANDRHGDPGLRDRCKTDPEVWSAALAWLVEGARKWYAAGKVMPQPPASVARDTRQWRTESDLILGYCDERLVANGDSHVLSTELLADFNGWLEAKGHRPWADKTFAARFGGHDELGANRVEKKKIRARPGLSRPPYRGPSWGTPPAAQTLPAVYAAWVGIRFRSDDEAEADEESKPASSCENKDHVPGVPGGKVKPAESPHVGSSLPAGTPGTQPSLPLTKADVGGLAPCPVCASPVRLSSGGVDLVCSRCDWWHAACETCVSRPADRSQLCRVCGCRDDFGPRCPFCNGPVTPPSECAACFPATTSPTGASA